ncbi:hypothetical protein VIGAN_03272500, partial [Vigna angularis var. angularis]
VEEAKQKIYACSTTTYTGFQAVMTEEESKKFEGLPGVIFVLPDSYIDPVNKQYGGMILFFFSEDLSMLKKLIRCLHFLFNFSISCIM